MHLMFVFEIQLPNQEKKKKGKRLKQSILNCTVDVLFPVSTTQTSGASDSPLTFLIYSSIFASKS